MRLMSISTITALLFALVLALATPFNHSTTAAQTRPTLPPRGTAQPRATPRTTPRATIAKPTPIATPAKVDAVPALSACASDIFGVSVTYTKSGGLTSTIARTLTVPTESKGTITATINAGATAVYGQTSPTGLQTLAYASGGGTADVSVQVSQASLCYLQFNRSDSLPTDEAAALALLKATFPGVPQEREYTSKTIKNGYSFYLTTTRPVKGSDQFTSQAIVLTVVKGAKAGQMIVSATSGTGTYATNMP
ncbi:MAG: hypothetical protein Fur005_17770 [Roseiflexaceae bacterium]